MTVVVLSVVLSLFFPLHLGGADGCADVVIVGVRGSGQQGFGEQVGGVVEAASAELWGSGRSVADIALEYPAVSITDSFGLSLFNGDYQLSVDEGVTALTDQLDDLRTNCPSSAVVLVGYSQGAQVIKLATSDRPPIDRIASIVLLADPIRDSTQPGVVHIGSQQGEGALGTLTLSEATRPITVDVCAVNDSTCTGEGLNFFAHIDGYDGAPAAVMAQLLAGVESLVSRHTTFRIS